MGKEAVCPWCGESVMPRAGIFHKEHGKVKERKCPKCNKIIAAYLEEKREVLERVRIFHESD
jgi:hypothetical protein